jgi:hypothetical protein
VLVGAVVELLVVVALLVGAVVELLVVVDLLAGAVVELLVVVDLLAGAVVVVVVLPAGALAVLPVDVVLLDVVLLDGVVAVPVLAVDELVEAAPLADVSEPPHADSKPIRTIAETQRSALVLDIRVPQILLIAVQNSISKKI